MNNLKADVRIADVIGSCLLLSLCGFAYYLTTTWIPPVLPGDPGAAFFPRISLAILFLFSIILLIQRYRAWRRNSVADDEDTIVSINLTQFLLAFSFSGALVAGINYVGFEPATFLFLFILLGWRTGRWMWSFIVSVLSVGFMYLLFVAVLTVRLPLLFLPKYFTLMNPF